jgi:hypothetical protein
MSLSVENTPPGVTAIINASQVSRPFVRQPSSTAFVIGFAPWGPIGVPTVITSWAEYLRKFGGFHALGWLAEAAYVYFNLYRGKQIIAIRAGGTTPVKASVSVNNRAVTPVANFKFEAKYASSTVDIKVAIEDITADTTNVKITVYSVALGITEVWNSVNLRDEDELAAFNLRSKLVNASLLISAVSGTTGRPTSTASPFTLANGDDDSDSVSAGDLSDYLTLFGDENMGGGQVLIPGYGVANQAAAATHCELYNRLFLNDDELATEYDDAATEFQAIRSPRKADYWPWQEMNNIDGTTGTKLFPPSIFAAGECAKADRTVGTHKAPANLGTVPNVIDVERNTDGTSMVNDNVRAFLNQRNVNVIGPIAGQGVKVYGARVQAAAGETRVQFVHEARMLNLIYYTAKQGYAWAVFAVVDGQGRLFRDLVSSGANFLNNLWRGGALFGKTATEAYTVVADESNNPPDELADGRVHVQLGVKLSPTAEQIFVNIDSVPLGQDLTVLNGGAN